MKSLSILILLGTTLALVIGGLFVVSPVMAENSPEDVVNQALVEAPAAAEAAAEALAEAPVAPATGGAAVSLETVDAAPVEEDPGLALNSTFAVSFEKDTSTAPVEQAANEVELASAPDDDIILAAQTSLNLESFAASLQNGNGSQIVGIYVDGLLAAGVTGQGGNAAYVSSNPNEVTRFGLASDYGSKGFLAHNYLAGATFSSLSSGQIITLVYGDGSTQDYQVQSVRRFQALSPNSMQSNFVDLDNGDSLSASQLFYQIYNSDHPVVLQTCIANDGISTWGRLFVIAVPVS